MAERIDYDKFGNVMQYTSPGLTPFGFTGGLHDKDSGLVRFGARDYDASVGRWTSKDPLRFGGESFNLCGYGLNDPVNHVDPNGEDSTDCAIAAAQAGLVCGAVAAVPLVAPRASPQFRTPSKTATAVVAVLLHRLPPPPPAPPRCHQGGDTLDNCLASASAPEDWANYCSGLPSSQDRARCNRHYFSRPVERSNRCYFRYIF